jgi:hypothetical protein
MGGRACLDRCRAHFIYYSDSISGGESMQFLDNKTKEKALAEDMQKTYGIERGSCKIIIKHINDVATGMTTNLMPCKLLRKCHKE